MIAVTLNIGLGDSKVNRCYLTWPRRLKIALDWLHKNHGASVRFRPGTKDTEPLLVAVVNTNHVGGLRRGLLDLATVLEQDAIAGGFCLYSERLKDNEWFGFLAGPGASLWEPWRRENFVTLEEA